MVRVELDEYELLAHAVGYGFSRARMRPDEYCHAAENMAKDLVAKFCRKSEQWRVRAVGDCTNKALALESSTSKELG